MAFRIENNIPVPPVTRGMKPRASKYPFARMAVGQSAAEPLPAAKKTAERLKASVRNAIVRAQKQNPEAGFTTRTVVENGKTVFRVWRTERSNSGAS